MSLADAQMLDSELRTAIDKASTTLNGLMSMAYESRMDAFEKVQKDMKKINSLYHDLSVEVRLLDSPSDQRTFETKAQEHNAKIKKLKEEITKKRSEIHAQPASPSGGGGGASSGAASGGQRAATYETNEQGEGYNPAKREAHETKDRIARTQNKTLATLDDAEKTLIATEDTAADATAKLQAQTDQMRKINDDLDQLDSEVERAKKELNAFIRRMMTDKILICFAILVLLGIVLIVVFNFVIKKDESGSADIVPTTTRPTTTLSP